MKNTFLVFIDPVHPQSGLKEVTAAEWTAILESNKKQPRESRRFFICDCFEDCGELDSMYIETTQEEYNKWHSEHQEKYRKRKCGEKFLMVSLSERL